MKTIAETPKALLSRNFSEQRKLMIHNGFRHLRYEIIIENFVLEQINTYPIQNFTH